MAIVVRHELSGCEGFRLESPEGLLGWVEETWIGAAGEPVALVIRTVNGRDGLLLAEDVEAVAHESGFLSTRAGTRLLELELPRVETASSNGLAASWRTTGAPLDPPPEPPSRMRCSQCGRGVSHLRPSPPPSGRSGSRS